MTVINIFEKLYKFKTSEREIKEKFEELFILSKFLGYSCQFRGNELIVSNNKKYTLSIFLKCKNEVVKRIEFNTGNESIKEAVYLTHNIGSTVRKSGYVVSFIVNDMEKLPSVMNTILENI